MLPLGSVKSLKPSILDFLPNLSQQIGQLLSSPFRLVYTRVTHCLSVVIFNRINTVINTLVDTLQTHLGFGYTISGSNHQVNLLQYADDTCLLANSPASCQKSPSVELSNRSDGHKVLEEVGRAGQVRKHCFALPPLEEGRHDSPLCHIPLQAPSGVPSEPAANVPRPLCMILGRERPTECCCRHTTL